MVKTSKAAKARVKRALLSERKKLQKAADLLADYELISSGRWAAIERTVSAGMHRFGAGKR
jgi:hypothetical protein